MARTVSLRLVELIVVLLLVSFGVFLLVSLLPGDPAVAVLGQGHTAAQYAAEHKALGLDGNVFARYASWLGHALTGDLGKSVVPPNSEVATRVMSALPVSAELAVLGLLIAVLLSVPLAMWSAARPDGVVDRAIGASMFAILSVPSFLAGLLLIAAFSTSLGWFPRAEWVRLTDNPIQNLYHALLPAFTIALMEMAMFTRVLRNDLMVTLREDFILAARAKGMPPTRILINDALRPSSFSLITLLGISLGRLIGSTVIVEFLFALPGLGSLIVDAANKGDFPMVQGSVLIIAAIYVVVNTCIDLSYGYLDPRTRRAHA